MKKCVLEDCDKKLLARGWCAMHYWRWQNYGDPKTEPPSRKKHQGPCAAPGCTMLAHAAGYCNPHYKRSIRHGDPLAGGAPRDRREIQERFQSNHLVQPNGCWDWTGELSEDGYGLIRHLGNIAAHRYSYGRAHVTEDFGEIDHRCRNRKCVNPSHLREVTRGQNTQNQATLRTSRSGYRGVAWHAHSKSWHVVVKFSGHQYSGGYFRDVHAAGRAAIALRNELYTHNEEDRKLAS